MVIIIKIKTQGPETKTKTQYIRGRKPKTLMGKKNRNNFIQQLTFSQFCVRKDAHYKIRKLPQLECATPSNFNTSYVLQHKITIAKPHQQTTVVENAPLRSGGGS